MILEGLILTGEGLDPVEGSLVVESGRIRGMEEGRVDCTQVVMPGLINSHTHIGDSIFKDRGFGLPIEELVRSPDGLKHRLLRGAADSELVAGMAGAESEMLSGGVTTFVDFREQGLRGVRLFRRAIRLIRGLAMGRPLNRDGDLQGELGPLIQASDGMGLDCVDCHGDHELEAIRLAARGKLIGVHAMEARRTPGELDRALGVLGAGMLVHLTQAERQDLRQVADVGSAVVVCPRSNMLLGLGAPPLGAMMEEGLNVALGSDNCMIGSPNIFREMELALIISRPREPEQILKMATVNGAKAAGISRETGSIDVGKAADLTVLRTNGSLRHVKDVRAGIVKRAGPMDVSMVLRGGEVLIDRRAEAA